MRNDNKKYANDIFADYQSGKSHEYIRKKYKISSQTVLKIIKIKGGNTRYYTPNNIQKENIVEPIQTPILLPEPEEVSDPFDKLLTERIDTMKKSMENIKLKSFID